MVVETDQWRETASPPEAVLTNGRRARFPFAFLFTNEVVPGDRWAGFTVQLPPFP